MNKKAVRIICIILAALLVITAGGTAIFALFLR